MNNSKFAIDSVPLKLDATQDISPKLRQREGELLKVIEALQEVQASKGWSSLKTYVLDGKTESLNKDILREAKKEIPDTLKLNRLAGELKWAERFSDLSKLENEFRTELEHIRIQLHGKTQTTG